MIEPYVDWLVAVYTARFGRPPAEPEATARAAAIIRGHAGRVPSGDEFVSIAAAEAAERLRGPEASPDEPFLQTLDKAADAARHRVMREARRWSTRLADPGGVPTGPAADEAAVERVKSELLEGLSLEEHLIVERLLAGERVEELAARLGVSRRTLYRRLADVRRRIDESG